MLSLRRWIGVNPRLLTGIALIAVGATALYHSMWLILVPPVDFPSLEYEITLWFWPMSVVVLVSGLLTLPECRGRTISWCCFVLFVVASAIHVFVRDLRFVEHNFWW